MSLVQNTQIFHDLFREVKEDCEAGHCDCHEFANDPVFYGDDVEVEFFEQEYEHALEEAARNHRWYKIECNKCNWSKNTLAKFEILTQSLRSLHDLLDPTLAYEELTHYILDLSFTDFLDIEYVRGNEKWRTWFSLAGLENLIK